MHSLIVTIIGSILFFPIALSAYDGPKINERIDFLGQNKKNGDIFIKRSIEINSLIDFEKIPQKIKKLDKWTMNYYLRFRRNDRPEEFFCDKCVPAITNWINKSVSLVGGKLPKNPKPLDAQLRRLLKTGLKKPNSSVKSPNNKCTIRIRHDVLGPGLGVNILTHSNNSIW